MIFVTRRRHHRSNADERTTTPLTFAMEAIKHVYEVRPRKDKHGVDLISDVLPFGRLWYDGPDAILRSTL
jgi:hypothetical protein